mgnify:FL=1
MTTPEHILAEFKSGKLETFYKNIYGQLLLYASRSLGATYSFLAEDCVQDAIYKAYQQRETFSSVSTFKSFLYSCIPNAAIDVLRKNHAQENYLSQQEEDIEFFNSIIEQETLNLLYDSIANLPEKYQKIFELNFQQGLKNAEIAKLLGVTESAIKKQKAQMIELVRKDLKKKTGSDLLAIIIILNYFYNMN